MLHPNKNETRRDVSLSVQILLTLSLSLSLRHVSRESQTLALT